MVVSLFSIMSIYCKSLKIYPNCSGSYIGYLDWIKTKKAAINLISQKDSRCFQYAVKSRLKS